MPEWLSWLRSRLLTGGSQVRVLPREFHGPIALDCCACATDLIAPARYRIVAQSCAARSRVRVGDASRSGGLGAIAGGLEGGTARPTSTVIHPSRLVFKNAAKAPLSAAKTP